MAGVESARTESEKAVKPARKYHKSSDSSTSHQSDHSTKAQLLLLESPSALGVIDICTDVTMVESEIAAPLPKTETTPSKRARSPQIFDSTLSPDLGEVSPFSDPEMDNWLNIDGLKVKEAGEALPGQGKEDGVDSEDNEKEFDEITKQIDDLTQTVANLQKSHPNLNNVTVNTDGMVGRREVRNSSSTIEAEVGSNDGSVDNETEEEKMNGMESSLSESKEKLLHEVDMNDPEVRNHVAILLAM